MHFDNTYFLIAITFLTSFVICNVSIPSIIKVAKDKGLVNVPGDRTVHKYHTPTLGGLAIFAGLLISLCLFADADKIAELQFIIAACIIVFFVGLKDDVLVIAPLVKLTGQIFSALILVVFGNLRFTNLHGFFGIFSIDYVSSILISVFFIIVVINSFNLIDGIDGLAAGIGFVTSLTYCIWFYLFGETQYALLSVCMTGSLLAFFRFNVFGSKNKIFMGDTGSLILGLILAILTIKFNELNINAYYSLNKYAITSAPAVSFGILIIPLFDTLRVVFIRLVIRKSLFKADKNHIHHGLLRLGQSHLKATMVLVLVNIGFIVFSFYCKFISIRRLFLFLLLLAMILAYIPFIIAEKRQKKIKKIKAK